MRWHFNRESDAPPYPDALCPNRVGSYPEDTLLGGGFVWDAVLEYRVWFWPHLGAVDLNDGERYVFAFATFAEAQAFAQANDGADELCALILQREYLDEPEPGQFYHIKAERVTEWGLALLDRPQRTDRTIPDFLAPDAPPNRMDNLT